MLGFFSCTARGGFISGATFMHGRIYGRLNMTSLLLDRSVVSAVFCVTVA